MTMDFEKVGPVARMDEYFKGRFPDEMTYYVLKQEFLGWVLFTNDDISMNGIYYIKEYVYDDNKKRLIAKYERGNSGSQNISEDKITNIKMGDTPDQFNVISTDTVYKLEEAVENKTTKIRWYKKGKLEVNESKSEESNIDKIKSDCSKPNIFISFRDSVNVSLINPKNTFGTPTGVYSYPAIDFLPKIKECNTVQEFLDLFPYKGRNDPSFIYLYQLNPKAVVLDNDSTFEDIKPFYQKLIDMYYNKGAYFERILDNVKKYIKGEPEEEDKHHLFHYDMFSNMTYNIRKDQDIEVHKFWTLTYHLADEDVSRWGNMFRKIGIDAFVDHGDGFIHSNEPHQALLLAPKMFNNFDIIEINDLSSYKNEIKKCVDDGEWIDTNKLERIYKKDPNWVINIFLLKVNKGDYDFISGHPEFIEMNKDNRIMINALQVYMNNFGKFRIDRLDERLIKILINKFGDEFFKKYIDTYMSYKPMLDLGDTIDLKRKILIGSLLNANKQKTIEFLNRHKEYNFKEEIEFLHDDPKLIKKHKDMNSYVFGGVRSMWDMFKDDDPAEKKQAEDTERRYELFKASYEKATGSAWDFDKFKERSQNWEFYGDYNGYIAVRPQASGFYKLVGSAGDIKSIMRGLNELIKENKPVWGMMTADMVNVLVKRYNFKTPPRVIFRHLFKMIAPSTFGGAKVELEKDGGVVFNYEDTGESKKYFVANKEYYLQLLNHDFFEKNKVLQKMLKFFIKRIS